MSHVYSNHNGRRSGRMTPNAGMMAVPHHGQAGSPRGGMMPFHIPSINVGGTSTPGGIAMELVSNGVPVMKFELYNVHAPLPSVTSGHYAGHAGPSGSGSNAHHYSGPGEPLGRPSADAIQRRRSASVMSNMELDQGNRTPRGAGGGGYATNGNQNGHNPLFDRISHSRSNMHTPMPSLSRSDVTPPQDSDGFAMPQSRPHSRMSNNNGWGNQGPSNGNGNENGWGQPSGSGGGARQNGFAGHNNFQQQGPRFRPYSSNSNRSNIRTTSSAARPRRDSYYPQYVNKKKVGEYSQLPADRQKPWFTPLPEKGAVPQHILRISNLQKGTTPTDLRLTALEFGAVEAVELLEEGEETLSMLISYSSKMEADLCVQKLDGVQADGRRLAVEFVDTTILHRPYMHSTDIEKRIEGLDERGRSSSVTSSLAGASAGTGGAAGGRAAGIGPDGWPVPGAMNPIQEQEVEDLESDITLD